MLERHIIFPVVADDLSKLRQAPDPITARSPVAESPDTTEEESTETKRLLRPSGSF